MWRDDDQEEMPPEQVAAAMRATRIDKDIATRCLRLMDVLMQQDGANVFSAPVDRDDCACASVLRFRPSGSASVAASTTVCAASPAPLTPPLARPPPLLQTLSTIR